jgi:2-methylcitrate dehydratase PrpD
MHGFGWAVFGAAAAIGRLIGLSKEQMRNALGLAYEMAPIRTPPKDFHHLPMVKYTAYGAIAEAAINAGLLAHRGFTGNRDVFNPAYEFWRGFGAPSCQWRFLTEDLGCRWYIAETALKPYPVGFPITLPAQLLREIILENDLSRETIDRVVVRLSPTATNINLSRGGMPVNGCSAPFSMRYGLAMAASDVPPGPQWHEEAHLADDRVVQFIERIEVEIVEAWSPAIVQQLEEEGAFTRVPTEVVVLSGGRRFAASTDRAKGDPATTESMLTDAEIEAKFREFTRSSLYAEQTDRAISICLDLEKLTDIKEFVDQLHV